MKNTSIITSVVRLWRMLPGKAKVKISILIIFMILSGFAEVLTLGSIIPFIAAITDPQSLYEYPILKDILRSFGVLEEKDLVLLMSVVFCSAVLLSATLRLIIAKLNFKWSFEIVAELGIMAFEKTLYQKYKVHISRNSSELVSGITVKTANLVGGLILPTISAIQLIILTFSILASLVLLLPGMQIIALGVFASIYLIVSLSLKETFHKNSETIAFHQVKTVKILMESLAGIKDIILGNYYKYYIDDYSKAEKAYRSTLGRNSFLILAPRFIVEALGMILIVSLAYYTFSISPNPLSVLPSVGLLALAAQRVLPYLQQLYAASAAISGNQQSNSDALDLLEQILPTNTNEAAHKNTLEFNNSIFLRDLEHRYTEDINNSLNGINLEIKKGEIIGIIGTTGSGKTTLIDIIMGLISPTRGSICIDETELDSSNLSSWQRNIAHVPQTIFLSDTSIRRNIAIGIESEDISVKLMNDCVEKSFLKSFIDTLPEGLDTKVGERGVQLSGGQRQRIGIARAFYQRGTILVLDEATNALDMKTEQGIVDTIRQIGKELTLLIVAHNLETIKNCNKIIIMNKGVIVEIGSFESISKTESYKDISGQFT